MKICSILSKIIDCIYSDLIEGSLHVSELIEKEFLQSIFHSKIFQS